MYTFSHEATLKLPAPVSCLCFGRSNGMLYAGADDGSVRLYGLPSTTVKKAFRKLTEVSSIVSMMPLGMKTADAGEQHVVWIADGQKAHQFESHSSKMILTPDDAIRTINLGQDTDDAINELSVNSNHSLIAFATDNGHVGVMDLKTFQVSRMKINHNSIAGSVKFIPDRPNEIVSGGYDNTLLHFDHSQRSVLSKHTFGSPSPSIDGAGHVTFSPPFVLCTAVSSSGLLAVGTADGRVWVGAGGTKGIPSTEPKKKRTRRWQGLSPNAATELTVANGPIVGIGFISDNTTVASSLLGIVSYMNIVLDVATGISLEKIGSLETQNVAKANALICDEHRLALGGFDNAGKGVVEVWNISHAS